jgi:peptidyl-tRNA hydrolase, PTH1 family
VDVAGPSESDSGIRLIAGLGNPGPRYQATRHNAGFWFADALAHDRGGQFKSSARFHGELCEVAADGGNCWILKPDVFMNRSGQAVAALAGFYKIPAEQILVVHDELDLPAGTVRLKQGGGNGGHNGLRSIAESLGSGNFVRLRIGIGHPGQRDLVTDYVLTKPSQEDRQTIEEAIANAMALMPDILSGKLERVMHKLHTK